LEEHARILRKGVFDGMAVFEMYGKKRRGMVSPTRAGT